MFPSLNSGTSILVHFREIEICRAQFNENLVASGVQIEAFSVEDEGEGLCFNVYIYNVRITYGSPE